MRAIESAQGVIRDQLHPILIVQSSRATEPLTRVGMFKCPAPTISSDDVNSGTELTERVFPAFSDADPKPLVVGNPAEQDLSRKRDLVLSPEGTL